MKKVTTLLLIGILLILIAGVANAANFSIGDTVKVTTKLNVRPEPGSSYEITDPDYPGYAPTGTIGKVLSGPSSADGYIWWEVDFGPGLYSGWSVEGGLALQTSPLIINGINSSYSTTTTPYSPTINLTGSGFDSITKISWSCTAPDGSTCTGSPYVWTPSSEKWSKFTRTSDTVASVKPTLLTGGDPTGTYNWSVTFSGAGQSVTKTFTVTNNIAPSNESLMISQDNDSSNFNSCLGSGSVAQEITPQITFNPDFASMVNGCHVQSLF